ncbi:unnamed protein product, partial [Rotaria sp. Silwood2]
KPAVNLDEIPISQWNRDDVAQWFQQNKIMPELYKLYQFEDGSELLTYAATILDENVLTLEQQLYSQAYSQANNGKVLLTPPFSRFTNALRKLHYDTKLKMQKSPIVVEPIVMNASNSIGDQKDQNEDGLFNRFINAVAYKHRPNRETIEPNNKIPKLAHLFYLTNKLHRNTEEYL